MTPNQRPSITQPLPGERMLALSPGTPEQALASWLRRPNLFPGRALTVAALEQRQVWQAGHVRSRGRALVAGIDDGLQVDLGADGSAPGVATVQIEPGRAVLVDGEDVVLTRTLRCALSDVAVVAPQRFFDNGDPYGDETGSEPGVQRGVGATLGQLDGRVQTGLPRLGVLLLQPVEVADADIDRLDPCDRSAEGDVAGIDRSAVEDWRRADAVRLLWYAWPVEWRAIPDVPEAQLRNAVAWTLFAAEAALPAGASLPWERWGAALALVKLDDDGGVAWVDRASVARRGGMARQARLQWPTAPDALPANGASTAVTLVPGGGGASPAEAPAALPPPVQTATPAPGQPGQPGQTAAAAGLLRPLVARHRLPPLWQAQMEQFAEQVNALAGAGTDELADAFGARLPPVGLMPATALRRSPGHPEVYLSDFFPPRFDIDAAPVPLEQLDLVVRASAGLAPLDPMVDESVRVLVPVPLQSWEPRLLLVDTVDPLFVATLNRFLLTRSRTLGLRQGWRQRAMLLRRAITGQEELVPAFDADPEATEPESLAPWLPESLLEQQRQLKLPLQPPPGGGHRSALMDGLHTHYFGNADDGLTPAAGDNLFVWVCLDPDHPPRGLALHWRSIEPVAADPAGEAAAAAPAPAPSGDGSAAATETQVLTALWHTGVCWGEDPSQLTGPGDAPSLAVGSPSLLPEAGRWVRLEVQASDLGLVGRTLDGMSFTLLDGRAAWGVAGRLGTDGVLHDWFGISLPAGATRQGNEPWDLMSDNDLWLPFEPDGGVSPSLPEQALDTAATLGAVATGGDPQDGVVQAQLLPGSLRSVLHPAARGWRGHLLLYRTLRLLPILIRPGLDLVLSPRLAVTTLARSSLLFNETAAFATAAAAAPVAAAAPAAAAVATLSQRTATVSVLGELVMATEPDAPNALRVWVYLDELSPPRALCAMLTGVYVGASAPAGAVADPSFTLRWVWGENRADELDKAMPGAGKRAPLSAQALPQAGQWVQLELALPASGSTANGGVVATGLSVYTLSLLAYDGTVAFSDVSVDRMKDQSGARPVWPQTIDAQGTALPGPQALLNARPVVLSGSQALRPTPSARIGTVRSFTALIRDEQLARLSRHEQSQLQLRGLGGFADYLRQRIDRADDITDFGFAHMQVDMHRIRQMMLSASDAQRLAVSPTLAAIAQSDNALAVSSQIRDYLTSVKSAPSAPPPPAPAPAAVPLRSFVFSSAALALAGQAGAGTAAASAASATASAGAAAAAAPRLLAQPRAARNIVLSTPVLGLSEIRTTALAERLKTPPSTEARDYALSNRHRTVSALLELLRSFKAEDFGTVPALFEDFQIVGLPGDPFVKDQPGGRRPLADFDASPGLLQELLKPPPVLGQDKPGQTEDTAAMFTQAISLSDSTIALLRQLEARLTVYRSALTRCESALAELQADADGATGRLARIADQLGEARHDVSVARALLAEETERIEAVNARRAKVLAEQVHFLAYIRPRETDNLLATPTHAVDPGLVEPPVPACLREHPDLPDELADMLRVVREAPAAWFVRLPVLLQRLDKVEQLQRALLVAQQRAVAGLALPMLMAAPASSAGVARLAQAAALVTQRQGSAVAQRSSLLQCLHLPSLAQLTWQGLRQQAEQALSFADLADASHGKSEVSRQAAAELDGIRAVVACLHTEFSGVAPALRLAWAELLSEFDAAPDLRSLSMLPRWAEIDVIDRKQMQAYVDWLFGQIEPGQPQAVALINDVVRMCLLLASHAPVDRIISGRLARPVAGVAPGVHIPLTVLDPSRLRVGMQALLYRGDTVVARALVADLGQQEVTARVIHTTGTAKLDLADDVRVHFDANASLSLDGLSARRSLFGR